jgi:uncharacterized protein
MTTRWFPDDMPVPAIDAETAGFWEAAADHRLVIRRCTTCGRLRHPPGPVCPSCRGTEADWKTLPGTGTVYTYTVVRQAFIPSLQEKLPYAVIAVELDDAPGVRLVSNLVDADPHEARVGMPVEVVWEDMGPELAMPRFRPATSAPAGAER